MAWAHLEEEPPSASERRPELPEAIDAVIRKAMAKEPDDRYTTCAALITAAEEALELRRPLAFLRHRLRVIAAVATLLILATVLVAAVVIRGNGGAGVVPPAAADTLVRIDPATYKVTAVVYVGPGPSAIAVGGRSVWVYNEAGPSVSEIDAATEAVRHTTTLVAVPIRQYAFAGPALAADMSGAWLIGVDQLGRSHLTRVFSGPRGKREYRLDHEPRAVAVGYSAVWVVTRGARDNQVLRIDPATNHVSAVVEVGPRPSATAVGGRSVWVYNEAGPSVSQIDAATGTVRHTTTVAAVPSRPDAFTGPVLAADTAGAWLIGVDQRGRPYLTCLFSGPRGQREYPLDEEPRAVAVGYGAVWVVARGDRDDEVLRIDPATGDATRWARFPASSRIDGLAAGLGGVWVTASSSATLYRIDPRSARVTGPLDLGRRGTRPEVVLGSIWVGLSDSGGDTVAVDPRTVSVLYHLGCCSPSRGDGTAAFGSIWSYDWPTGTLVRWDGRTHQVAHDIRVTDPPFYDGLCLTSIAAGAGAVWVTVAASSNYRC